ncbi:MAG: class I SAM-dependent methyltransferase [Opitutaceae bacterium]
MNVDDTPAFLGQQLAYYRARAAEYDQWWLRQGRYDRGPVLNARWFAEAEEISSALLTRGPFGRVLELACGTGIWTGQLLPFASELTAMDGSPEMIAINAARVGSTKIRYIEADLFQWHPTEQFDTVFFSFWLSHVPPARFEAFWELVQSCLAPGGRVFFLDSRHEPTSTALDHRLPGADATVLSRRLNDGREYQIVKVFYDPIRLTDRMVGLGWSFEISQTERYFIVGAGGRSGESANRKADPG